MEGRLPCYYTNTAQTAVYRTGQVTITNACVKWTANGYRLPTEAEWEKAARGGLTGKRFPWGNRISQGLANYWSDPATFSCDDGPAGNNVLFSSGASPYTSPAGSFAPNAYGLYDMAGNVKEWVWDAYSSTYYTSGQSDPHGPDANSGGLLRGGGYDATVAAARCAGRVLQSSNLGTSDVGFRCVRGL